MIKVVIADHHPITVDGVSDLLRRTNEYKVVGKVFNGTNLKKCLYREHPDVLIIEITIPEISGFRSLRELAEEFPQTKIAIYSSHPEEIYALRSIKSGATAYIPKTSTPEKFIKALNRIKAGGIFLNAEIAAAFHKHSGKDNSLIGRYRKLSAREIEVLDLLTNGKRNKDIASLLEINEKTVSTYKTRLLKKLKVNSLAELITQSRMLQHS